MKDCDLFLHLCIADTKQLAVQGKKGKTTTTTGLATRTRWAESQCGAHAAGCCPARAVLRQGGGGVVCSVGQRAPAAGGQPPGE
jgi:hypothetical protein